MTANPTAANPTTHVAMLLDESSSMAPHKTTTLSALNEYIQTLKNEGGTIHLTLVAFSSVRTHFLDRDVPINEVVAISDEMYQPNGSTPLIDAAMKLIKAAEEKAKPGEKVIIALQTDGEENCSKEFKLSDLQAKIKEMSDAGWQFVFLGAGLDAYQAAASYGIHAGATLSYGTDAKSTRRAFQAMASNTALYASGGAATMDWSDGQKEDAGDVWKPDPAADAESGPSAAISLVDDIEI